MEYTEIKEKLESLKNPKNVEGMARFGIKPKTKVLGISIPELRKLAKEIKINNELSQKLWDLEIHEARLLAIFIADYKNLTEEQMDKWVSDFDSWDITDQACGNLFDKTNFAYKKVFEFSKREEEFVKRTAFALMAALSVHNKEMKNEKFIKFFPLIKKASNDERNFVKKAVNWALRQIGKRNKKLNKEAIKIAKEILNDIKRAPSKSAKWIASDAIRELTNEKLLKRIKNA